MKLPVISARDCIAALERMGLHIARRESSHITMRRDNPFVRVTIPDHKTLKPGTLRGIIRQAGLTVEEFVELLKDK